MIEAVLAVVPLTLVVLALGVGVMAVNLVNFRRARRANLHPDMQRALWLATLGAVCFVYAVFAAVVG